MLRYARDNEAIHTSGKTVQKKEKKKKKKILVRVEKSQPAQALEIDQTVEMREGMKIKAAGRIHQ